MAAITLESDSSHSPPVLDQSNERSSKKSPKKAKNLLERGDSLREFSQGLANNSPVLWQAIPASRYKRKFNVVKIKNTNE